MLTIQKKFKSGVFAAALVTTFAVSQPLQAAVEKPNLKPYIYLAGAGVTVATIAALLNTTGLQDLIEEKAIDTWIAKSNLNQFGEPQETVYANAVTGPLKKNQSRIAYIKAKFVDEDSKPWRSGFVRMLDKVKNLELRSLGIGATGLALALVAGFAVIVLDSRYESALWREKIDQWKEEEKKWFASLGSAIAAGLSGSKNSK